MEARATRPKRAVRADAGHRRRGISPIERHRWSEAILHRLAALPEFAAAARIALYAATVDEVQTEALFARATGAGKAVYYPTVGSTAKTLTFRQVDDLRNLRPGYGGVLEPRTGPERAAEEIDLVIVPGVAFDRDGHRVGRGGGFYDRWLPRVRGCRIGLAFECQLVDRVAAEAHDQQVDMIVTEERIIRCAGRCAARISRRGIWQASRL